MMRASRRLGPAATIALGVATFLLVFLLSAGIAHAAASIPPAPPTAAVPGALDRAFGELAGAQTGGSLSLSLQLLLIMGLLTILPSLVLMMTSFTRILVVLVIISTRLGKMVSNPMISRSWSDSDRLPPVCAPASSPNARSSAPGTAAVGGAGGMDAAA